MELSDARKIVAQTAKQFEAARALEDAASTIIEAQNNSTKATNAYADLKKQIESAKAELSECKTKHTKQQDKWASEHAQDVQALNTQLAARQAEADATLTVVQKKINEAHTAYARELGEHEERIAKLSQQESTLQTSVSKLTATIEKLKASIQSV